MTRLFAIPLEPEHGRVVACRSAVTDAEIIELDEEPAPETPWRAGSLTIVAAPIVVIAVVVSAVLWNAGRAGPDRVIGSASARPDPAVRGPGEIVVFTPRIFATRPPEVVTIGGEAAAPEILAEQRWMGVGPTYSARGDVAEAVLGGDAYVIGGTGSTEEGRLVYRYDRRTGMRMRAADLPVSLDHAMAATLGDRVFVFGGFVSGQPSLRVFSLGANDAEWVEHNPMPAARAAGGAAVVDQRVYIVGGVGSDGRWVQDTWSYDTRGGWYAGLARMPTPRDHLAVGTHEGRVCAAGGNGGERAFECYEPLRDEWTKMPDLRKPVVGARATEIAGWFWVIQHDVHVFAVDHWHFGPRLLTPRAGHAVVVINGAIYVIEGAPGVPTARMERLTPRP
jgi:hypothetical protein